MKSIYITVIFTVLCSSLLQLTQGNACCSYPCQNQGICNTKGFDSYTCDCTGLDYYGDNCEHPTLWKRFVLLIKPSPEGLHHLLVNNKWLWTLINNISYLKNKAMKRIYTMRSIMVDSPAVYESVHEYPTLEAALNYTYFARTLPPVPTECPTPLGVKGKKVLPDVDLLVDKFFKRTTFLPDPLGSSVLFTFFAQHFTHQFFKTDFKAGPAYQWGGHGVDVSHIYGRDKQSELTLRSMKDGKMKMQVLNGEEFPPYLKDAPVHMIYPPGTPDNKQFALGQQVFGLLPGLFVYATIWLREHNRVCDVLKQEHPEWDDERLFQTAKLIITGETIKIVIEDYVQHLSNYHYKLSFNPELLFGEEFQYQNRITIEFNHLYHWHPLMPDEFNISGTVYPIKDFVFQSDLVIKHGMKSFVDSFSKQRAGMMSHHNHCYMTLSVVRDTIKHGRELRLQSLNRYRQRFGLPAYKSFQELTGETKMAAELEELYGDIDGLEFYVGLIVEKRREKAMFGSSIVEIGGPYSVKGLMSNPICSPKFWKPSTFGGEVGFNLIKTASIQKLFCQNIKGECPTVSFQVPNYVEGDVEDFIKKFHDEL
ncbi:prostaglandin G/H synthase 2 [Patella vulgata]|uniref:prostaglandin G/H synthase 2 n=1 Tax=Patella vulgata TaxID=6465 RepID=UPI00217FA34D|nr:prostaglandin G/H synthase 2 [Patella vulgata]